MNPRGFDTLRRAARALCGAWWLVLTPELARAQDSPVMAVAHVTHYPMSDALVRFIASHYAMVVGTDNHGYNFPGEIAKLRAIDPDLPALCNWNALDVQATDSFHSDGRRPRWSALDVAETAFMHSADPASLRVVQSDGRAVLWFRMDGRNFPFANDLRTPPPGVSEYVVEVASGPDAPFQRLSVVLQGGGSVATDDPAARFFTASDSSPSPGKRYRVRSRLSDGRIVPYSGEVSLPQGVSGGLAQGFLGANGEISALCYGERCPRDAKRLRVAVDLNRDYVFDPRPCSEAGASCESWSFNRRGQQGRGVYRYRGSIGPRDAQALASASYRIFSADEPSLGVPDAQGETYQVYPNNHRLRTRYATYLLWPDDPTYVELTRERLRECLDKGFSGMRFDFAIDDIKGFIGASGLTPQWQSSDPARLRRGVRDLLAGLNSRFPGALLTINGFFAAGPDSFHRYLENIQGGEFEFFAFGNDPRPTATQVQGNTLAAMTNAIEVRRAGKRAFMLSYNADPQNTEARLKALALYLMIADEQTYFHFTTSGFYDTVNYFPEWDVPLGAAARPYSQIDGVFAPAEYPGLWAREYANGWVFFNPRPAGSPPVNVPIAGPSFRLRVSGGRVEIPGEPRLPGERVGSASYEPVTSLSLAAGEAAILVRKPPRDARIASDRE